MLQLKKIVKDYQTGDEVVKALKGISINFRKNEFDRYLVSPAVVRQRFLIL